MVMSLLKLRNLFIAANQDLQKIINKHRNNNLLLMISREFTGTIKVLNRLIDNNPKINDKGKKHKFEHYSIFANILSLRSYFYRILSSNAKLGKKINGSKDSLDAYRLVHEAALDFKPIFNKIIDKLSPIDRLKYSMLVSIQTNDVAKIQKEFEFLQSSPAWIILKMYSHQNYFSTLELNSINNNLNQQSIKKYQEFQKDLDTLVKGYDQQLWLYQEKFHGNIYSEEISTIRKKSLRNIEDIKRSVEINNIEDEGMRKGEKLLQYLDNRDIKGGIAQEVARDLAKDLVNLLNIKDDNKNAFKEYKRGIYKLVFDGDHGEFLNLLLDRTLDLLDMPENGVEHMTKVINQLVDEDKMEFNQKFKLNMKAIDKNLLFDKKVFGDKALSFGEDLPPAKAESFSGSNSPSSNSASMYSAISDDNHTNSNTTESNDNSSSNSPEKENALNTKVKPKQTFNEYFAPFKGALENLPQQTSTNIQAIIANNKLVNIDVKDKSHTKKHKQDVKEKKPIKPEQDLDVVKTKQQKQQMKRTKTYLEVEHYLSKNQNIEETGELKKPLRKKFAKKTGNIKKLISLQKSNLTLKAGINDKKLKHSNNVLIDLCAKHGGRVELSVHQDLKKFTGIDFGRSEAMVIHFARQLKQSKIFDFSLASLEKLHQTQNENHILAAKKITLNSSAAVQQQFLNNFEIPQFYSDKIDNLQRQRMLKTFNGVYRFKDDKESVILCAVSAVGKGNEQNEKKIIFNYFYETTKLAIEQLCNRIAEFGDNSFNLRLKGFKEFNGKYKFVDHNVCVAVKNNRLYYFDPKTSVCSFPLNIKQDLQENKKYFKEHVAKIVTDIIYNAGYVQNYPLMQASKITFTEDQQFLNYGGAPHECLIYNINDSQLYVLSNQRIFDKMQKNINAHKNCLEVANSNCIDIADYRDNKNINKSLLADQKQSLLMANFINLAAFKPSKQVNRQQKTRKNNATTSMSKSNERKKELELEQKRKQQLRQKNLAEKRKQQQLEQQKQQERLRRQQQQERLRRQQQQEKLRRQQQKQSSNNNQQNDESEKQQCRIM